MSPLFLMQVSLRELFNIIFSNVFLFKSIQIVTQKLFLTSPSFIYLFIFIFSKTRQVSIIIIDAFVQRSWEIWKKDSLI